MFQGDVDGDAIHRIGAFAVCLPLQNFLTWTEYVVSIHYILSSDGEVRNGVAVDGGVDGGGGYAAHLFLDAAC